MNKKEKAIKTLKSVFVITRKPGLYSSFQNYMRNKNTDTTYDVRNAMRFESIESAQTWLDNQEYVSDSWYVLGVAKNTIKQTISKLLPTGFELKKYDSSEWYISFNNRWLSDTQFKVNDFIEKPLDVIDSVLANLVKYEGLSSLQEKYNEFEKEMIDRMKLEPGESIWFNYEKGAIIRLEQLHYHELTVPLDDMTWLGFRKSFNNKIDEKMNKNQDLIEKLSKENATLSTLYYDLEK